jgi:hypothetical protein
MVRLDHTLTWYLTGPMSGVPEFNYPLFISVGEKLRAAGINLINPAEITPPGAGQSWGHLLGRDVELVADKCGGIILLPRWERSRGSRLEAYTGLLCGHAFALWMGTSAEPVETGRVMFEVGRWPM